MRTSFIWEEVANLVGLFFPNLCHICDKYQVVTGQITCIKCMSNLLHTDYNHISDNPFIEHFYGRVPVSYGACLYHFSKEGTVRNLLHAIKYKDRAGVGRQSGRHLGEFLMRNKKWREIDYIIPVPLHPRKLRMRGYNQCDLLAEGISTAMHKPIWPLIKRVKFSISQTKKGRTGRIEALNGVFAPDYEIIRKLRQIDKRENAHFLIVDDVLTTGATLQACSTALLKVFPKARISLTTLAMGRM